MASRAYDLEALKRLPVDERIMLVQELWDSVEDDAVDHHLPISDSERNAIRRSLEEYRRNPASAREFHEVITEITGRKQPPDR